MTAQPADWSRLHPLTPLLRSGKVLLAVVAVLTQQGLQQQPPVWALLGFLAAATLLAAVFGYLSWRTTRYRLTAEELQVESGLLQKRSRRVPLARLQSVDLVRPLLGRVLGLAELRLEVAGGGQTEAPLAYLSDDDAQRLRVRMLSAGADVDADEPEPVEALLVQVPTGALVLSILLGAPTFLAVALVAVAGVLLAVEPSAAVPFAAALVPVGIATGTQLVQRLLAEYGSTVAESADGLRLRHGLLETRAQTIPLGRVQTVRVIEPLLWRRLGWVRVEVDVAGYSSTRGQETQLTAALLPVAPREFALQLVARVLGAALPAADSPAPRRARWRSPVAARYLGLGLDRTHVVARWGVLSRRTDVVPLAKVQSLRLVQGPWQRRLGLASVHVDSAGRRLPGAALHHRDAGEAQRLLADLTELARAARVS